MYHDCETTSFCYDVGVAYITIYGKNEFNFLPVHCNVSIGAKNTGDGAGQGRAGQVIKGK